jgi:FdhD protein
MSALETAGVVPSPAHRVPRQAWRNGSSLIGERTLAEEVPVAFSYDGATHAVLMATPDDLEDFAVGFSYTEGIITAPAEIAELAVVSVADGIVLRMWLTGDRSERSRRAAAALSDRPDAACADWRVWPKPIAQYR